jgi:hypothetical protein
MPIVVTFKMDAPSVQVVDDTWLMALPLWHIDAVAGGGVHSNGCGGDGSRRGDAAIALEAPGSDIIQVSKRG